MLANAVPKCFGSFKLQRNYDIVEVGQTHSFSTNLVDEPQIDPFDKDFLQIENVTAEMTKPCIIDIKLASKPYNPKKIARQQFKIDNSTCGTLGFRMCGYSSFLGDSRVFVDKYFGRTLKPEGLTQMLRNFFQNRTAIVTKLIPLIAEIRDSLEQAKGVRFFGSSLILAYCTETEKVNCKLVDFQNACF